MTLPQKPPHNAASVALLIDTSTQWARSIISGINRYKFTQRTPWNLLVEPHGSNDKLMLPEGWRGDGVIAAIHHTDQAKSLRRHNIPVVNVSDNSTAPPRSSAKNTLPAFPKICTDRKLACAMAVEHFRERGFTNFAYIQIEGSQWDKETYAHFRQALRKEGIRHCENYQVRNKAWGAPDWSLDIDALAVWLLSLPKPIAVFSWSVGREVIHACRRVGLKVPEEVALLLLSYDDIFCEVGYVPISGIIHAWEEIGYKAAIMLERLLSGRKIPAKELTQSIAPVSVLTRQSTDTLAITNPVIIAALGYIRENSSRPLLVDEVAQHAGVSRRKLERHFWQVMGRTPAEHISHIQLSRAKLLLAESNQSIPAVAQASGFSSPEYMATVFRKHLGITPLKYRKEHSASG